MALTIPTRVLRRISSAPRGIAADLCVLGAGIAGVSAAIEAARLGARVVLIDGAPNLGGQSVAAQIGTFCGLFANGRDPPQVTHGIADDILRDLGARGDLSFIRDRRNTVIVQYRIDALARWIEEAVRRAGITVLLGAVLREVRREASRIAALDLVTRYGEVTVSAAGFVDATGDAALAWTAGLPVREAEGVSVQGTQMIELEQVDEAALAALDRVDILRRVAANGAAHGLSRQDGFAFAFPGRGTALINMTHFDTPLDPVAASALVLEGHALADRLVAIVRREFPAAFGKARIRSYGLPGMRQTRSIVGAYHLTAEDVRAGRDFADAVARCSWPIELHNRPEGVHWEEFGDDHMHYVPLRSLAPPEFDNLLAVGRCIDADPVALSSVRVMGPCIAMGAAAAHAFALAGSGSVHQLDIAALRQRLAANLGL
ncbi:MAG TPA: FAD-dependent oxidoreductase [Stellaceae bacterium]|nr:FAD-dependent oxidoreductase [Stellaceae bacterium]